MISNETLKKYKEAKEELSKVKVKVRNIEEEISKEIFENFISGNYKIKEVQGSIENPMFNPRFEDVTVFYPELEIPKGFEKKDGEIDCWCNKFGVGDIIHEYTLKNKMHNIVIHIKEESHQTDMIPKDTAVSKEIKYTSMIWIRYEVKIGRKKFIFSRDYEQDFIKTT